MAYAILLDVSKAASLKYARRKAIYHKQRREERKAAGLCTSCGKPAKPDRTCCEHCLDRYKKQARKQWRKHTETKTDKRLLLIAMSGGKCFDCGYSGNPAAFEFDHVRGVKKAAISNMLNIMYAWETVLEEVAKCELVCANCHRVRTHNRRLKVKNG